MRPSAETVMAVTRPASVRLDMVIDSFVTLESEYRETYSLSAMAAFQQRARCLIAVGYEVKHSAVNDSRFVFHLVQSSKSRMISTTAENIDTMQRAIAITHRDTITLFICAYS